MHRSGLWAHRDPSRSNSFRSHAGHKGYGRTCCRLDPFANDRNRPRQPCPVRAQMRCRIGGCSNWSRRNGAIQTLLHWRVRKFLQGRTLLELRRPRLGAGRGGPWRRTDTRRALARRINTMGEVPVLETDGQRRSQSGAILIWLAETIGKFAPAGGDERFEAMRWLLFDNHRFTNNLAMHRVQNCFTLQAADPAVLAFLRSRVESTFLIVENHLADRPFVLGERPTIADFSMAGYVYYPAAETGFDIAAQFPSIDAWRRRVAALSGWRPPYELMPVGSSLPRRAR